MECRQFTTWLKKPKLSLSRKGRAALLTLGLLLLTAHNTAQADSIFKNYIPCAENGNCPNHAGKTPDEEVGCIGCKLPEYEEPDEDVIDPDSEMCTVDQPAHANLFTPRGEDEQTEGDCSILGCLKGNLVEIDDDSDISEEDQLCKLCNSGNIEIDAGKEGEICGGDGSEEQSCYTCQDGKCDMPACEVDREKIVTVGLSEDVDLIGKYINMANKGLRSIPPPFRVIIDQPQVYGEYEYGQECCEYCGNDIPLIGNYHKLQGGAKIGASAAIGILEKFQRKGKPKVLGVTIDYEVDAEVFGGIKLSAEINANAQGQYNFECKKGCAQIGGSADLKLEAGIEAKIDELDVDFIFRGTEWELVELKEFNVAVKGEFGALGIDVVAVKGGDSCPKENCMWRFGEGVALVEFNGRVSLFNGWVKNKRIPTIYVEVGLWKGDDGPCF